MSYELKPCPFCGGVAVLRTDVLLYDMVRVECTQCGAETKVVCADGNLESFLTAVTTACELWDMRSEKTPQNANKCEEKALDK